MKASMTKEQVDYLADRAIWNSRDLTYSEVQECGWNTKEAALNYVRNRWYGLIGKRAITIRSNRLQAKIWKALSISGDTNLEGSLWQVQWDIKKAINEQSFPQASQKFAGIDGLESASCMQVLGYVVAADATKAKMAASVTLGPRAHQHIKVFRIGIADWEAAKRKNENACENYKANLKKAKNTLAQKMWEIEQIECQINFLECGATFDSVEIPVIE